MALRNWPGCALTYGIQYETMFGETRATQVRGLRHRLVGCQYAVSNCPHTAGFQELVSLSVPGLSTVFPLRGWMGASSLHAGKPLSATSFNLVLTDSSTL